MGRRAYRSTTGMRDASMLAKYQTGPGSVGRRAQKSIDVRPAVALAIQELAARKGVARTAIILPALAATYPALAATILPEDLDSKPVKVPPATDAMAATVRFTFSIRPEIALALDTVAIRRRVTVANVVLAAVRAYHTELASVITDDDLIDRRRARRTGDQSHRSDHQ